MRARTLIAVASIATLLTQSHADEWTGRDKVGHAAAGALIAAAGTVAFQDRDIGLGIGLAAGVAKELYDNNHRAFHDCSWKDFAATAVGAYVGSRAAGWVITPRSISYRTEF